MPNTKIIACSRCAEPANPTDRWEHGWPNYGRIELGLDSCGQMTGWGWSHPAMPESRLESAQRLILEWGTGHGYDSEGRYRLCRACQRRLWETLAQFFKATGLNRHADTPLTTA